ncbi:MAG: hypothetical protein AVDCRST_MAG19-2644, partial [uncultured Thermomicrobiales bacterium]
ANSCRGCDPRPTRDLSLDARRRWSPRPGRPSAAPRDCVRHLL